MLPEAVAEPTEQRIADLNVRYSGRSAADVLKFVLNGAAFGRTALVSSFGAESVVLLHLVSEIDRSVPILFLDTEMLFPETLDYQRELSTQLGLTDVRVLRPERGKLLRRDPDGDLHMSDTDGCCAVRKVEPLEGALASFDAWITGRKRFQNGSRVEMPLFESENGRRMKVNPLARWTPDDVRNYVARHRLPPHPLVSQGYLSIGCAPCTTRVLPGEPPRSGRWRGRSKEECGIHFSNGKAVRLGGAVR